MIIVTEYFFHLKVARCTKIIDADTDHPKYVIHVKQFAKFVVNLHKNLAPTDVEEGMRVGYVFGLSGVYFGIVCCWFDFICVIYMV
jgi:hypothetical protein